MPRLRWASLLRPALAAAGPWGAGQVCRCDQRQTPPISNTALAESPRQALLHLEKHLATGALTLSDVHNFLNSELKRGFVANGAASADSLKIISYNILADMYATGKDAKHGSNCDPEALGWPMRKHRIFNELLRYDPDIVCLQEVQANHYADDFVPMLENRGYRHIYCLRTPWELVHNGQQEDGVAIFWKSEKFEMKECSSYLYRDLCLSSSAINLAAAQNHAKNVAKEKGCLITLLLTQRSTGRRLIVGNTQLYHNPQHADIKVSQAYMAANQLHRFAAMHRCANTPVVLCGDFNSQPKLNHNEIKLNPNETSLHFKGDEQSGVYELLSKGALEIGHMHHPASWNPAKNAGMARMELPEKLVFASAYKLWLGMEPTFTTKTTNFTDTVDYIWLSPTATPGLCGILGGVPSDKGDLGKKCEVLDRKASAKEALASVDDVGSFPSSIPDSVKYPSDHVAIGCIINL